MCICICTLYIHPCVQVHFTLKPNDLLWNVVWTTGWLCLVSGIGLGVYLHTYNVKYICKTIWRERKTMHFFIICNNTIAETRRFTTHMFHHSILYNMCVNLHLMYMHASECKNMFLMIIIYIYETYFWSRKRY